jgi:hypothetical protein
VQAKSGLEGVVVEAGKEREVREDEQEVVDEEVLAVAALSSPLLPFSPTHPALASLKMLSGPMTLGTLPPLPPTALPGGTVDALTLQQRLYNYSLTYHATLPLLHFP